MLLYPRAATALPTSVLPSDQIAPGTRWRRGDHGVEGALDPVAIRFGDDQRRQELDGVAGVAGDLVEDLVLA